MFGFFKREQEVEDLLHRYTFSFAEVCSRFRDAIRVYIAEGVSEAFSFEIEQTHKAESHADDVRNQVETLMFEKALLPESRGDVLNLLEALDRIPGHLQGILYMMHDQRLGLPDFLSTDLDALIEASMGACDALVKYTLSLLEGAKEMRKQLDVFDRSESRCDFLERRMIQAVFASGIDPFAKLQLRDLIARIAQVSDETNRMARAVYILSVKRRV